ncbi:Stf0 family sulfotransferase [Nocardioides sp. J54]|uniref:Stf0 family sulfotransferase n=1 Tax=Nocardioides sp. J54 TaxID=935866 RepID=UPI00048CE86A|nr:Stf0 family sulfotransferase [Nocardioides sp. J54]
MSTPPADDATAPATAERWDQFGAAYDLPEFEGTPRTWLMASTGRSGSHYLGHLLTETGALGAPLEYLHPTHGKEWCRRLGVETFEEVLVHLYRHRTSPTGWWGTKAHWPQFRRFAEQPALLDALHFERYVQIRRRDVVAQGISLAIARQTKAWISFQRSDVEPEYDAGKIRDAIATLERQNALWDDYFAQNGITPLRVEYEDLLADTVGTVNRVLEWFGVERQPGAEPLVQPPQRQADQVNEDWKARFLSDGA